MKSSFLIESPLTQELSFLIARARSVSSSLVNRQLERLGLRVRSYSVLALACSGHQPTQREIAEFLSLDPSQIVTIIDDLETRGLVERTTSPQDRRRKVLQATPTGDQLFAEARKEAAAADDAVFSTLTDEQRAHLVDILKTVAFPR